jgi:hypothetical protein
MLPAACTAAAAPPPPSLQLLFRELFGEEEGEEEAADAPPAPLPPGAFLLKRFLSKGEEAAALGAASSLFGPGGNQAMRFGALPDFCAALGARVPRALLPPGRLDDAPPFDQLIANAYAAGEGIAPHVDLDKFEDGIAAFSLGAPALMAFERVAVDGGGGLRPARGAARGRRPARPDGRGALELAPRHRRLRRAARVADAAQAEGRHRAGHAGVRFFCCCWGVYGFGCVRCACFCCGCY